ncbi:DUF3662 and FHA domain-containing protein [soil metagenome]
MNPFKPLNRIEQSLERAIEGAIDSVFKPSIQPSEIARKLAREMSDRQLVTVRGTLVPNAYRVSVNTEDFKSFGDGAATIAEHLSGWLDEEAARLGFHMVGSSSVELEPADLARNRSIKIESTFNEQAAQPPRPLARTEQTEAFVFQRTGTVQRIWVLEVVSGPLTGISHWIGKQQTSLGRAWDNDFVLNAPDVSRHHARIDVLADSLRVSDLGSMNGTFVNQRPVHPWVLVQENDILVFGQIPVRLFVERR